jgi:hypothetical protein
MACDAGFEHAVQLRQNLLQVMRRHHAPELFGGLMMRHREIGIRRGHRLRLLLCPGKRCVLARLGWAGVIDAVFEQPAMMYLAICESKEVLTHVDEIQ